MQIVIRRRLSLILILAALGATAALIMRGDGILAGLMVGLALLALWLWPGKAEVSKEIFRLVSDASFQGTPWWFDQSVKRFVLTVTITGSRRGSRDQILIVAIPRRSIMNGDRQEAVRGNVFWIDTKQQIVKCAFGYFVPLRYTTHNDITSSEWLVSPKLTYTLSRPFALTASTGQLAWLVWLLRAWLKQMR